MLKEDPTLVIGYLKTVWQGVYLTMMLKFMENKGITSSRYSGRYLKLNDWYDFQRIGQSYNP